MSPWLQAPPLPLSPPGPLPERVEVLIIGGSLAGLQAAALLAEAGARVLLVEARSRLAEADLGRGAGLCQVGTEEPPAQLREALGPERFAEYLAFSLRSAALLDATGAVHAAAPLRACASEAETAALDADLAACAAAGLRCAQRPAEALRAQGITLLGPARACPEDRAFHPVGAAEGLARRALQAGAALHLDAPVRALEPSAHGERAHLDLGAVQADLVLLTCGWGGAALDPLLGQALLPVRHQHLAAPWAGPPSAGSAQRGYLFWQAHGGWLVLGGARWATPHLEVWETEDRTTSTAVQQRLGALRERAFPGAGPPTAAWSAILTHTCDNLPLIGPLPGRPRRAAAVGFREHGAALGLEAGRCLAQGVLEGQAPALPGWLSPGRLL